MAAKLNRAASTAQVLLEDIGCVRGVLGGLGGTGGRSAEDGHRGRRRSAGRRRRGSTGQLVPGAD